AFFTLGTVVAVLRFLHGRDVRLLYLGGVVAGLAAATKEDVYLTGVVFAAATAAGVVTDTKAARRAAPPGMPLATASLSALPTAAVLYTALLTHPEDWNAPTRAIRYWWGQHRMERIAGPWWYYLPLELAYEPVILFAALAALIGWVARGELRGMRA